MAEAFKTLISPALVNCLGQHLSNHCPSPASHRFAATTVPQLDALELKARVQLIADEMIKVLPAATSQRNAILMAMLHPDTHSQNLSRDSDGKGIAGWGIWPLSLIVGQHGLDAFDSSMELLREMTMRSTSEFAIRYFLQSDQERALAIMTRWLSDPNAHVRRLVSEGSRPRLPWGMKLSSLCADPSPTLALLDALKDDPSEYVRRSVANHLNDISRDNPTVAVTLASCWIPGASRERMALTRHACRTLIKAGHPQVLSLFGYAPPELEDHPVVLSRDQLRLGESLELSTRLTSTASNPQSLLIDYIVFHRLANGNRSAKVFKGGVVKLAPGQSQTFVRTHRFHPVTTRRYYAGQHAIALRINGVDTAETHFELQLPGG